jgi:hypothetical protein
VIALIAQMAHSANEGIYASLPLRLCAFA